MNPQHPTPLALERFHAGEETSGVSGHVDECGACRAYIDGLAGERQVMLSRESGADFARRIRMQGEAQEQASGQERNMPGWLLPSVGVFAVVAVMFFGMRPPDKMIDENGGPSGSVQEQQARLKGGLDLTLIVDRNGEQSRMGGEAELRAGDRIRVEVVVPRARTLTVGILDYSGEWMPLATDRAFPAGSHVLEKTLEVDAKPMKARVMAGLPVAVQRALAGNKEAGVVNMELRSGQQE